MIKKILFGVLIFNFFACDLRPKIDFNDFSGDFIRQYAHFFPDETPLSIKNPQLEKLHIPTVETIDSIRLFYNDFSTKLKSIESTTLTDDNIVNQQSKDIAKMKNILNSINVYLSNYDRNPILYNVYFGFNRILNTPFATPSEKLEILNKKLERVPFFYETAKSRLSHATIEQADETIKLHINTYLFFDKTLPDFIKKHQSMTPQYQRNIEFAKLAIKDYVAYVESLRLN